MGRGRSPQPLGLARAACLTRSTIAGSRAHMIGRVSPWNNDGVELVGFDLAGRDVRLRGISVFGQVGLPALRADDLHVAARFAQAKDRIPELEILVELLDEHRDATTSHVFHVVVPVVRRTRSMTGRSRRPRTNRGSGIQATVFKLLESQGVLHSMRRIPPSTRPTLPRSNTSAGSPESVPPLQSQSRG